MKSRSDKCPCHSGARYRDCCAPLHEGKTMATTPEALMRSRFSAFALGLGAYLVDTLAANHEDRSHDPKALAMALSRAKDAQRFMGLDILETSEDGDRGTVKFRARIFERGVDKSFTEKSAFAREHGAWKYVGGEIES
ncbi:MAG: YchJ family protein [Polyangiaceae bacterium]